MNQNQPKIVKNQTQSPFAPIGKSGFKKPYEKPEIIFKGKQQLQVYLVDLIGKNKNPRFNKKVILT